MINSQYYHGNLIEKIYDLLDSLNINQIKKLSILHLGGIEESYLNKVTGTLEKINPEIFILLYGRSYDHQYLDLTNNLKLYLQKTNRLKSLHIEDDFGKKSNLCAIDCLEIVNKNKNIKEFTLPIKDFTKNGELEKLFEMLLETKHLRYLKLEDDNYYPHTDTNIDISTIENNSKKFFFKIIKELVINKPSDNELNKLSLAFPILRRKKLEYINSLAKELIDCFTRKIGDDKFTIENVGVELEIKFDREYMLFLSEYINFVIKNRIKVNYLSELPQNIDEKFLGLSLICKHLESDPENKDLKEIIHKNIYKIKRLIFLHSNADLNSICLKKILKIKDENDIPYLGLNTNVNGSLPVDFFRNKLDILSLLLSHGAVYEELKGESIEEKIANSNQSMHSNTDVDKIASMMNDRLVKFTESKVETDCREKMNDLLLKIYENDYDENTKFTFGGKEFNLKDFSEKLNKKFISFIENKMYFQITEPKRKEEKLKKDTPEIKKLIDENLRNYIIITNNAIDHSDYKSFKTKYGNLKKIEDFPKFLLYRLSKYIYAYTDNIVELYEKKVKYIDAFDLTYTAFGLLMQKTPYNFESAITNEIDVLDKFCDYLYLFSDWATMYSPTAGSCATVVKGILSYLNISHDDLNVNLNLEKPVFSDQNSTIDLNSISCVEILTNILNKDKGFLTEKQIDTIKEEIANGDVGDYFDKEEFDRVKTLLYGAIFRYLNKGEWENKLSYKDIDFIQKKILPENFDTHFKFDSDGNDPLYKNIWSFALMN